ncbi:MAG: valine--pyruvate transaminase [Pirellulales bacterium]
MEVSTIDPEFSRIGRKLAQRSAILELMDDLGHATIERPQTIMLGGGNPAAVPPMQALWRRRTQELLADVGTFDAMIGRYDPPQGNPRFLRSLAALFERSFGWPVTQENVAVTNGTQTTFFFLFSLLAGQMQRGSPKKILLPMSPEYIGYADQGLIEGTFVSCRPAISWPEGEGTRVFKYRIDFAAVEQCLRAGNIAAIAVSRPSNPTGNVLTAEEIQSLSDLAARYGVYLVIDNAYGIPFPGIVFTDARPHWAPHVINTLSLSKLGLPGVRTGMVVGPPKIIDAIRSMTAIVGLANGNIGQQLLLPQVESGEILEFGPRILAPFYQAASRAAQSAMREFLGPTRVDWAIHVSEGTFFLWLWLRGLPMPTKELYERLKMRNVLVVPGEFFFFGLGEPWPHQHECLRVSFAQPEELVREGIRRLAEEVSQL